MSDEEQLAGDEIQPASEDTLNSDGDGSGSGYGEFLTIIRGPSPTTVPEKGHVADAATDESSSSGGSTPSVSGSGGGPIDIEHAIDLLAGSCEKACKEKEDAFNENGDVSSQQQSRLSSIRALGSVATFYSTKKEMKVQLNETNHSSSDEEAMSPPPVARRRQPTKDYRANHRRNVIAAVVVSVALIVLVGCGLGLGISGKGNEASESSTEVEVPSTNEMEAEVLPVPTVNKTKVEIASADEMVMEVLSTNEPSNEPSMTPPTVSPSNRPTPSPSFSPTNRPTPSPSFSPTSHPSTSPSDSPTTPHPTDRPSTSPSTAPSMQFLPGELLITDDALDIRMSSGLKVKLIAEAGKKLKYANGKESRLAFHGMMDGAGVTALPEGGYVYVSNSEMEDKGGGVYGLYFDKNGDVTNYRMLLNETNRNCGGGLTPWQTWISCEEVMGGQCWQIDPHPLSLRPPRTTLLGDSVQGGKYESVAVDNRNPERPIFFTTEDHEWGALRMFQADRRGWHALHTGGNTTLLNILDESTFEWTTDEGKGRTSANTYFRNAEGISYHDGLLYFTAKKTQTLFILDLDKMTYETETTGAIFSGQGDFNAQPDQLFIGNHKKWIYFTEDGGAGPGVHIRERATGTYRTLFEGIAGSVYAGDETVGLALSPDRKLLFAGFQDAGVLFEFAREDGLPFE